MTDLTEVRNSLYTLENAAEDASPQARSYIYDAKHEPALVLYKALKCLQEAI